MFAMAHGSNDINVSASITAEFFMLYPSEDYNNKVTQEFYAILIALFSILAGTVTLGGRYLNKYRDKFMNISSTNGFIANTITSILLFFSSYLGYTVSSSYIYLPILGFLTYRDGIAKFDVYKSAKAFIYAAAAIFISAFASVSVSYGLLWLDYAGPYSR